MAGKGPQNPDGGAKMPEIRVIRDIDKSDEPRPRPEDVVHVTAPITIGTLEGGMVSGKTSLMLIIPLPDGKTLVAETSLAAFRAASMALSALPE
jgi:hypothetical protein